LWKNLHIFAGKWTCRPSWRQHQTGKQTAVQSFEKRFRSKHQSLLFQELHRREYLENQISSNGCINRWRFCEPSLSTHAPRDGGLNRKTGVYMWTLNEALRRARCLVLCRSLLLPRAGLWTWPPALYSKVGACTTDHSWVSCVRVRLYIMLQICRTPGAGWDRDYPTLGPKSPGPSSLSGLQLHRFLSESSCTTHSFLCECCSV
jgi:hypothetical protein